jgi:hypothetical protein
MISQRIEPNKWKQTHNLASPVIGIGIKDELTFVRKGQVEHKGKGQDCHHGQQLQPSCAPGSRVVGGKGEETHEQQEKDLQLLTEIHCDD